MMIVTVTSEDHHASSLNPEDAALYAWRQSLNLARLIDEVLCGEPSDETLVWLLRQASYHRLPSGHTVFETLPDALQKQVFEALQPEEEEGRAA